MAFIMPLFVENLTKSTLPFRISSMHQMTFVAVIVATTAVFGTVLASPSMVRRDFLLNYDDQETIQNWNDYGLERDRSVDSNDEAVDGAQENNLDQLASEVATALPIKFVAKQGNQANLVQARNLEYGMKRADDDPLSFKQWMIVLLGVVIAIAFVGIVALVLVQSFNWKDNLQDDDSLPPEVTFVGHKKMVSRIQLSASLP